MALQMLESLGEIELKNASGNEENSLQVIAKAIHNCQQTAAQWAPHIQNWLSLRSAPLPTDWCIHQLSFHADTITSLSSASLGHASHQFAVAGQHGWAGMNARAMEGRACQLLPPCLSCLSSLTHPLPVPCPKKASESQSLLFHPLLYSILPSAAGWDKTLDYK